MEQAIADGRKERETGSAAPTGHEGSLKVIQRGWIGKDRYGFGSKAYICCCLAVVCLNRFPAEFLGFQFNMGVFPLKILLAENEGDPMDGQADGPAGKGKDEPEETGEIE